MTDDLELSDGAITKDQGSHAFTIPAGELDAGTRIQLRSTGHDIYLGEGGNIVLEEGRLLLSAGEAVLLVSDGTTWRRSLRNRPARWRARLRAAGWSNSEIRFMSRGGWDADGIAQALRSVRP